MVQARRSTAQGNKAAIKQAKVGGSWKPTDEPTTTWKRQLNATRVVLLQTRTTALQTKARDYYGRDYDKGQAPEHQLRTERELPTVRMDDTKLRRSYRLNTKREKYATNEALCKVQNFASGSLLGASRSARPRKGVRVEVPNGRRSSTGCRRTPARHKRATNATTDALYANQQNFAIGSLLGASRLARLREKLRRETTKTKNTAYEAGASSHEAAWSLGFTCCAMLCTCSVTLCSAERAIEESYA
jgi:hypothetical protein